MILEIDGNLGPRKVGTVVVSSFENTDLNSWFRISALEEASATRWSPDFSAAMPGQSLRCDLMNRQKGFVSLTWKAVSMILPM